MPSRILGAALDCGVMDIAPRTFTMRSLFLVLLVFLLPALVASVTDPNADVPELMYWDYGTLVENKRLARDCPAASRSIKGLLEKLRITCDGILNNSSKIIYSVTVKNVTAASGNRHDYYSLARYYWPDPKSPDGLPYIRKDGEPNPEVDTISDQSLWKKTVSNVQTLALGYFFWNEPRYAFEAARIVRQWFLDSETAMNPNLNYASVVRGYYGESGRPQGILDFRDVYLVLDSLELIQKSGAFSELDHAAREMMNNHGTWYRAQVAAVAFFLNRTDIGTWAARNLTWHIDNSIDMSQGGVMRFEVSRVTSFSYSAFDLRALLIATKIASNFGVNLLRYTGPEGQSIHAGIEYMIPHLLSNGTTWPFSKAGFDRGKALFPVLKLAVGLRTEFVSGLMRNRSRITYKEALLKAQPVPLAHNLARLWHPIGAFDAPPLLLSAAGISRGLYFGGLVATLMPESMSTAPITKSALSKTSSRVGSKSQLSPASTSKDDAAQSTSASAAKTTPAAGVSTLKSSRPGSKTASSASLARTAKSVSSSKTALSKSKTGSKVQLASKVGETGRNAAQGSKPSSKPSSRAPSLPKLTEKRVATAKAEPKGGAEVGWIPFDNPRPKTSPKTATTSGKGEAVQGPQKKAARTKGGGWVPLDENLPVRPPQKSAAAAKPTNDESASQASLNKPKTANGNASKRVTGGNWIPLDENLPGPPQRNANEKPARSDGAAESDKPQSDAQTSEASSNKEVKPQNDDAQSSKANAAAVEAAQTAAAAPKAPDVAAVEAMQTKPATPKAPREAASVKEKSATGADFSTQLCFKIKDGCAHSKQTKERIRFVDWHSKEVFVFCKYECEEVGVGERGQTRRVVAISHVWGQVENTSVQGIPWVVPRAKNKTLAKAFDGASENDLYWLDVLSIDQENKEELFVATQQMSLVFGKAAAVNLWLKDECEPWPLLATVKPTREALVAMMRAEAGVGNYPYQIQGKTLTLRQASKWLHLACKDLWFGRVWTTQEMALARKLTYANQPFDIENFKEWFDLLAISWFKPPKNGEVNDELWKALLADVASSPDSWTTVENMIQGVSTELQDDTDYYEGLRQSIALRRSCTSGETPNLFSFYVSLVFRKCKYLRDKVLTLKPIIKVDITLPQFSYDDYSEDLAEKLWHHAVIQRMQAGDHSLLRAVAPGHTASARKYGLWHPSVNIASITEKCSSFKPSNRDIEEFPYVVDVPVEPTKPGKLRSVKLVSAGVIWWPSNTMSWEWLRLQIDKELNNLKIVFGEGISKEGSKKMIKDLAGDRLEYGALRFGLARLGKLAVPIWMVNNEIAEGPKRPVVGKVRIAVPSDRKEGCVRLWIIGGSFPDSEKFQTVDVGKRYRKLDPRNYFFGVIGAAWVDLGLLGADLDSYPVEDLEIP
ncbi:hypothetical protein HDU96_007658 [Phlyctochytrium bullatum]|nr:hypothetical protein HDU96_007658 [Phlyctochytrium bullatum]